MALPQSVRFLKNGEGGQWWTIAKTKAEMHLGWSGVPDELIARRDYDGIRRSINAIYGAKKGATQDFNALRSVIERPSQYLWVTVADGRLWWCTAKDSVIMNDGGETSTQGHFAVPCERPWSDRSEDGTRLLLLANLPGSIAAVAGFRATICQPGAWRDILRVIENHQDDDVVNALAARASYEATALRLIRRLRPKDFELLVDLMLSRSGWSRQANLGETTEGIDIEAYNAATDETAFVQIKSEANQATFNDYVDRFRQRRDAYQRMIFAVHSTGKANLSAEPYEPVQIWDGPRLAQLTVRLGLADWLMSKV